MKPIDKQKDELFDKRDQLVEEVEQRHKHGELTLKERHEEIEEIQREFIEAMRDLNQSK